MCKMGQPANGWVYWLCNKTLGEHKIGRASEKDRRVKAILRSGFHHWKPEHDIEVVAQRQVLYTNDAEHELHTLLGCKFEITDRSHGEVKREYHAVCKEYDQPR